MEEDGDLPKTLVKLRKITSDSPRPASTPPTIAASGAQDEDDEEKIMAELEVRKPSPLGMNIDADTDPMDQQLLMIPLSIMQCRH